MDEKMTTITNERTLWHRWYVKVFTIVFTFLAIPFGLQLAGSIAHIIIPLDNNPPSTRWEIIVLLGGIIEAVVVFYVCYKFFKFGKGQYGRLGIKTMIYAAIGTIVLGIGLGVFAPHPYVEAPSLDTFEWPLTVINGTGHPVPVRFSGIEYEKGDWANPNHIQDKCEKDGGVFTVPEDGVPSEESRSEVLGPYSDSWDQIYGKCTYENAFSFKALHYNLWFWFHVGLMVALFVVAKTLRVRK
jgi:hypothetical protein